MLPILRPLAVLLGCAFAGSGFAQQPEVAATTPAASPRPGFFVRFADFYRQDWHPDPSAPAAAAAARRGPASPLDSPPFPSADWSYGGSPTIGEADGNSYPLQTAINGARSRTKIYGWIEPTLNFSSSAHSNYPESNDSYSNRFELNQAVVYVERLPNSVQRDHIDFGFHLTAFYGTDYRFTTDKGYLSSQLLIHNRQYGFDPVLEYVDVYVPQVAHGMNVRAGRFISIPGIEAQLSPNDYFFSHSVLYTVDPFTDTGILATIQLSDRWTVQAGITASHDVALWTADAQPSFTGCVSYTSKSVRDNLYACANGINNGEYAYNNVQHYDLTWYHKIGKTWHAATEVWGMYQRDVPAVGGPIAAQLNSNGAVCRPGQIKCLAPAWAAVNYINRDLSPHTFVGFRSDFLADKKGQRTGFNTKYTENTLALSHWIGTTVQFRPEIRFEHAWDRNAYDRGTRESQFTIASDVILHF